MDLTLRQARKLETRIQGKINEMTENAGVAAMSRYSEQSLDTVSVWLNIEREDLIEQVEGVMRLSIVRGEIRRNIQGINENSGINEAISRRQQYIDQINLLNRFIPNRHSRDLGAKTAVTPEILANKLKAINEGQGMYDSADSFNVFVINTEQRESLKKELRVLDTKIDEVNDTLLQLNATNFVSITAEDAELLKRFEILE